jgi:glycosyltransferase involved in cell wall biosynthesis
VTELGTRVHPVGSAEGAANPADRAASAPASVAVFEDAGLSVVVCAYSWARLELTVSAVDSLLTQNPRPLEVLVVVDYNDKLREALAGRLVNASVMPNEGPRGLSGARNTGLDHARGAIVAFVDDDAEAAPGWAAAIVAPFADPAVVATGGLAVPHWEGETPAWFPEELLWAVGCSYRGMTAEGEIRNPFGCNMAFRAEAVHRAGLFDPTLGRLGNLPFGCEETELCVRLRRQDEGSHIVMAPAAVVRHHVPAERANLTYLWRRSYYEGIGKAILRRLADSDALGTERSYALTVLPRAVATDLLGIVRLSRPNIRVKRIAAVTGSLGLAGLGYLVGLLGRTKGPAAAMQKKAAE